MFSRKVLLILQSERKQQGCTVTDKLKTTVINKYLGHDRFYN